MARQRLLLGQVVLVSRTGHRRVRRRRQNLYRKTDKSSWPCLARDLTTSYSPQTDRKPLDSRRSLLRLEACRTVPSPSTSRRGSLNHAVYRRINKVVLRKALQT